MLTQEDKKFIIDAIRGNVDSGIKGGFQDFYENIFAPHVEQSMRDHAEIVREINSLKRTVGSLEEKVTDITDFIKDHEKRVQKVETITGV